MADGVISLDELDLTSLPVPEGESFTLPRPTNTIDPTQLALTPYDNPEELSKSQRIGIHKPDRLPIMNIQGVDNLTRLATQFAFDTAEEKALYLKKQLGDNYEFAVHPSRPADLIIKRKGAKEWSVIDPGGLDGGELLAEFGENADSIAQMATVPVSVITAGLAAGGIQALRQTLKKAMLPESDFRQGKVVIDAASGMAGAGLTGLISGTAKKGVQTVAGKTGSLLETATNEGGILNKVGKKLNVLDEPTFLAKEMGATAKGLDPTNADLIVNKIARLQKATPEFMERYRGAWTTKGKFEALNEMLDRVGTEWGQAMQNLDIKVPVRDILNSQAAQQLKKAASDRVVKQGNRVVRVDRKNQLAFQKVERDLLEDIGSTILSDDFGKTLMKQWRTNKLHTQPFMREMGIKTNDEALLALIGEESMNLSEAFATRLGRDQIINYNKRAGQITAKNTVDKYTADAMREAIRKSVIDNMGDAGEELLTKADIYTDLFPVVKTLAGKVGKEASATWNPIGKILPGMINSAPRFAAKLGVNLSNQVEVRNFMAKLANEGMFPIPQTGGTSLSKTDMLGKLARGSKFNIANQFLEKNFLPRDVEEYYNDPEKLNRLISETDDPELADALTRQFERGDKEGMAQTISLVASEREDIFDKAPYKSLVTQNGKPVLTDKYDRKAYRDHLDKVYRNDPAARYKAKQALGLDNEMVEAPFQPPPAPKVKIERSQKPQTTVGRVANALKKTELVELDDGTERVEYDY